MLSLELSQQDGWREADGHRALRGGQEVAAEPSSGLLLAFAGRAGIHHPCSLRGAPPSCTTHHAIHLPDLHFLLLSASDKGWAGSAETLHSPAARSGQEVGGRVGMMWSWGEHVVGREAGRRVEGEREDRGAAGFGGIPGVGKGSQVPGWVSVPIWPLPPHDLEQITLRTVQLPGARRGGMRL